MSNRNHTFVSDLERNREKRRKQKRDYQAKTYDINQYSEPASKQYGCERCQYLMECKQNLWAVRQGDGLLYEPLRCFAEHPEYDPSEWVVRKRAVQEELPLERLGIG